MKIFLGMPIALDRLVRADVLEQCLGSDVLFRTKPNNNIARGRNALVQESIISGSDYYASIDSDTLPPDDWIKRLVAHDKDVICGLTPVYLTGGDLVWNVRVEADKRIPLSAINHEKLFKIKRMGGTTCLVKRKVLESIGWPWYEQGFGKPNKDGSIPTDGEDYVFSQKILDAGFDIWCDPSIVCHHYEGKVDLLPSKLYRWTECLK